jgi:RHH-type rel operon transcriptional repressor/antitoxin RelB
LVAASLGPQCFAGPRHLDILKAKEYIEYTYSRAVVVSMPTSIRLEEALERRLDDLARRTGRTKAYYLRELVQRGLDDLEDYYLATETMERVRKGEEKVYSADEVRNDLGLDD